MFSILNRYSYGVFRGSIFPPRPSSHVGFYARQAFPFFGDGHSADADTVEVEKSSRGSTELQALRPALEDLFETDPALLQKLLEAEDVIWNGCLYPVALLDYLCEINSGLNQFCEQKEAKPKVKKALQNQLTRNEKWLANLKIRLATKEDGIYTRARLRIKKAINQTSDQEFEQLNILKQNIWFPTQLVQWLERSQFKPLANKSYHAILNMVIQEIRARIEGTDQRIATRVEGRWLNRS